MKIVVIGLGYVGTAMSLLLAKNNEIVGIDLCPEKVSAFNRGTIPIDDSFAQHYFDTNELSFVAKQCLSSSEAEADYIIICTPTNYDENTKFFDTSAVEAAISHSVEYCSSATIVIKSTIPIGFIDRIRTNFPGREIFFAPEFLREGQALSDNLNPTRIVIGSKTDSAKIIGHELARCSKEQHVPLFFTGAKEAEAIKLFANTYLAMRVAYFNELDNFAFSKGLVTREIVEGICADPRIDSHYNNPSFGYGGYCLPKDTKQLLSNFEGVPQSLIRSIVSSNEIRINFLFDEILKLKPKVVGIYRLIMKQKSDNFRSASVLTLMHRLQDAGVSTIIYEPILSNDSYNGTLVYNDFPEFVAKADLILANRTDEKIIAFSDKVFSRDIFQNN